MKKKNIPFGMPLIDGLEHKAVRNVMSGPQLVHGPKAKKFEEKFGNFIGGKFCVSLNSCTAGLHLSYMYFGIGAGDEVIVPAQSHVATAHAVEYTGAKPIFVDVEKKTGNIDITQIQDRITNRTKAIGLVHFAGLPVDMHPIIKIAKKNNLFVVEDAALALGAKYNNMHVGLLGDVGSFSFYPVKHITTAEGGMLVTKNEKLFKAAMRLKAFGYDKMVGERRTQGLYDVDILGYNFRMNEIQASIGIEQLKKLKGFLRKRKKNSQILRKNLNEFEEIRCLEDGNEIKEHANYCLIIVLNNKLAKQRFEVMKKLKGFGIGTSIYYPGPIPNFKYYRQKYNLKKNHYPNALEISVNSIALPVGPHLDSEDMLYISNCLKNIIFKEK